MPLSIATPALLDSASGGEVQALADAVESRDGQPPLSDQALTQLQSDAARHVVAREGAELRGYAQLDGTSVEVVGDAGSVAELLDVLGDEAQLVWSHGRRSPVGPLLEARGFRRTRVLHQLRRSLLDALPDVPLAGGVTIRDFVPGVDEQAWLRVNAAAFATHAEQGRWTEADLAAREAEPWFDPAGFLLAERDGTVIGFHWTKIHGDGVGEVYVLGVDPAAQGLGLGPALLVRGLRHLTERGCSEVLLYVDESNGSARRLYERFGFHTYDTDVQWTAGAVPDIPDATP